MQVAADGLDAAGVATLLELGHEHGGVGDPGAEAGEQVLGVPAAGPVYASMNALAARVPRGADGLRCEPFFTGTRADPAGVVTRSRPSQRSHTL